MDDFSHLDDEAADIDAEARRHEQTSGAINLFLAVLIVLAAVAAGWVLSATSSSMVDIYYDAENDRRYVEEGSR